jgi:hypothetical protein
MLTLVPLTTPRPRRTVLARRFQLRARLCDNQRVHRHLFRLDARAQLETVCKQSLHHLEKLFPVEAVFETGGFGLDAPPALRHPLRPSQNPVLLNPIGERDKLLQRRAPCRKPPAGFRSVFRPLVCRRRFDRGNLKSERLISLHPAEAERDE